LWQVRHDLIAWRRAFAGNEEAPLDEATDEECFINTTRGF
jgi:hypothetical protein